MISLGIDIGGTGCKCVAFRHDGKELALSYAEYPLAVGQVNLPPKVLSDSVFQVIGQCVEKLEEKQDIRAITVSSFGESFVAVDKDGNDLTILDIIPSDFSIVDDIDKRIKIKKLREYLQTELNDRERKIIVLRYGLNGTAPLPQREVAKKLKISRSYVSRIEKKALEKLYDKYEGG